MAIFGTGKIGTLGGKIPVQAGSVTFNAPGVFTANVGLTTVNVTGRGGAGNPGGTGNPGNVGTGGNGGQGGSISLQEYRFCDYNSSLVVDYVINSNTGPGNAGAPGGGGNPANGTPGNTGSAGNPGSSSSALGRTFPGGAGGNGGSGGTGGSAGGSGTVGTQRVGSTAYSSSLNPAPGGAPGGGAGGRVFVPPCNKFSGGGGGAGVCNPGNPGACRWMFEVYTPGICYSQRISRLYSTAGNGGTPGGGQGGAGSGYPGETLVPARLATAGSVQRAGGGGGAGKYTGCNPCAYSAGGGGGGGRGGVGNPGSTGNPGQAATPTSFNGVPVTPGASYPVTVAPGGTVTINWDAQ